MTTDAELDALHKAYEAAWQRVIDHDEKKHALMDEWSALGTQLREAQMEREVRRRLQDRLTAERRAT